MAPKCQGAAAKDWLAARQAEPLPVQYYHVVFTLPVQVADIACPISMGRYQRSLV